ncbi:renalase-like [Eurytemora carolleeae]|uniref:renalase-like n=1 Tax=Eurytemora carolleeae TaxID=1294199 RepID=UPI000C781DD0|nr:renalase-like [Eurytemora carolleeae]|eukprot:XP_023321238.1 renalase-like [Eurytemora affinis]
MSSCARILVVGGGITSAATVSLLAETIPQESLTVWDKARGAGGRMSTSRSTGNPQCKVDLGAQYVSASSESQVLHKDMYNQLLSAGVLTQLDSQGIEGFRSEDPRVLHYTAPNGMSTIVKHFFQRSGAQVHFNQRIVELSKSGNKWKVVSEKGLEEEFETVVLTMPVPQILELGGDIAELLKEDASVLNGLKSVRYSSRFVLGLFFDENVNLSVEWTSKYINKHPIFRFISIDNLKRGDEQGPTSVLVHSSVPFGVQNIDVNPEQLKDKLINSLFELFPMWPKPASVKCMKWKYSQVSSFYPGNPGSVVISRNPNLILAGDAFSSSSNFEGCLNSASSVANIISKHAKQEL